MVHGRDLRHGRRLSGPQLLVFHAQSLGQQAQRLLLDAVARPLLQLVDGAEGQARPLGELRLGEVGPVAGGLQATGEIGLVENDVHWHRKLREWLEMSHRIRA